MTKYFSRVYLGVIFLIIISEIIIYAPCFRFSPDFKIERYLTISSRLVVEYSISTGIYPTNLSVTFFVAEEKHNEKEVYIYYDPNYQMVLVDKKTVNGFIYNLISELSIRNYSPQKIKVINAIELQRLMLNITKASNSIVIIPTGAFPDTVYTREKNLVKPWIIHGGILIWTVEKFGYYSARKTSEPMNPNDPWHPKDEGQKYFFNATIIVNNDRTKEASIPTRYARALYLLYRYVYRGVSLTAIRRLNGIALGYIDPDSNAVSIAMLPLGCGKVIIFGGESRSGKARSFNRIFAHDIAQIITSGILEGNLVTYREYHLQRYAIIKDIVEIPKTIIGLESGVLIIFCFEAINVGVYFEKIMLHFSFSD